MYEELITALRQMQDWNAMDFNDETGYAKEIIGEAADSIEDLSEGNVALNGTISNLLEQFKTLFPQWISVKDRLPKKDEEVLIFYEWTGPSSGTIYREITLSTIDEVFRQTYRPLYWMPIPEPPKEVDG